MKRKHPGHADSFRNLATPLGALALGVAVFAATISSADNNITEKVSPEAPIVFNLAKVGPQSATAPPDGGTLHASPAEASRSDDLIPVFKATAAEGTGAASAGRAGFARGGTVGDPCTCDADCAALDDINNCLVGVCDDTQACAQESAPIDTWCDTDGLFCTLEQCNGGGSCVPTTSATGVTRTPCAMECVGGTRPGLFCAQDTDCPGGGTCTLKVGGVCDDVDDQCETVGDLGRCCSADGTTCEFVDEASCTSGLWLRIGNPSDLLDTCICPKYSSGVAPEGVDGTAVGPILPSNKTCGIGGNICEGDGFADCPKRCSGGDTPDTICSNDVECALTGTCDDGTGDACIPTLLGADCVGAGANCVPDNPAPCLPDTCDVDATVCSPATKFLSVGDDYSTQNGSALRLQKFRFRGGLDEPGGTIVFEFFDDSRPPKFVNAFAIAPLRLGTRTWTVTLDCFPDCDASQNEQPADPPFIIPANGHVMMRSSRAAGGAAVAHWVATTSPADTGLITNDPTRMWIDGDPDVDHLGPAEPNVLAFEFVGEKISNILGACCDPAGIIPCADTPSWECSECPDGTPCSRSRECGTEDFCLPVNWHGPESHDDFQFGGGKLCASNVCTAGACCDPNGSCTEVDPADCPAGSEFQGLGTSCSPNCCQQPVGVGGDCACDTFQCSTDGGATFTGVDCTVNGVADCQTGETCEMLCAGPTPHVLAMPFQCRDPIFGGAFEPPVPCDPGPAGDALCESVASGSLCDLELFGFEKTIPFTVDSSGATIDLLEGDSCALDSFDVGWHEGFTLTECGVVTVDHCCDPGNQGVKTPVWIVIQDGCPCGVDGGQTVSPDVNALGSRNGFGAGCNAQAECCPDGNWSGTFTLRPGTYTWQIAGGGTCGGTTTNCDTDADCLAGVQCQDTLGPYNGHITYERCPLAACCDGESCSVTDKLACQDMGGDWLGDADNPVVRCPPDVPNPCAFGSCCTGPGACDDSAQFDEQAECLAADPQNVYHGGVTCIDEPCPVCDFKNDGNCKFDDGRFILPSDRALVGNLTDPEGCPAFLRRAEDFRPASNEITNICWWPSYFNPFDGTECAANPPPDDFHVRFFEDDGGLPGLELGPAGGQPLVPDAKEFRGGNSRVWEMTATLDTPIAVTAGDCYWIEITGKGDFDGTTGCVTYVLESLEGNGYGLSDGDGTYGPEDVSFFDDNPDNALADAADIAYCISSGLASNNDCQVQPVCCLCGSATNMIPMDCKAAGGIVLSGETDPGTAACPTILDNNDDCTSAVVLTPADCGGDLSSCQIPFDNRCATTDGPVESCFALASGFPGAGDEFVKDLWYLYTAPGSGEMTVSTCNGTNYDSMVAVYPAGAACDECPTGGICGDGINQDPTCVCDDNNGDPGCNASCFATSELTMNVQADQCYFIRVGGDRGSEVQMSGSGILDISLNVALLQPPTLAPPPHDIRKNRYISIDALTPNSGLTVFDIKATLTSTQVNGVTAIGSSWWAGPPDDACISIVSSTRPATAPDWTACPTIHLTGCPIIPTSVYDIVIADGGAESVALAASTQSLPAEGKWWGDSVGQFLANEWTPPQGVTNFDDVNAAIKTFQKPAEIGPVCANPPCNAVHVSRSDVEPNNTGIPPFAVVNKLTNFADVQQFILAFQGGEYPGNTLENCP